MENNSDTDIVISDKEQIKKERLFFFFFYLLFIFLLSNIIIVINGSIFSFVHFLPNRKHYNEISILRNLRTNIDYTYIYNLINKNKTNELVTNVTFYLYEDDDDINDDDVIYFYYYKNKTNKLNETNELVPNDSFYYDDYYDNDGNYFNGVY
jgi:hypothetical protein